MFWKKYIDLCIKNGTSPNAVAKNLNISSGAVTKWKNGTKPNDVTLNKIADFFNVSVDYLLGNETQPQVIEPNAVFLDDKRVYMIPMYESVSAGFGASAINEVVGYEPCHIPNPADAAESLCIRVSGDSMFPKIEDGDIIRMHDIYNNTYEATVILLERLNEMGYNVVTVSELLGDKLEPGKLYTQG